MYKYIWLIFSLIIYGSSIAGIQPSLQNKSDQIKQGVAGTTTFEWDVTRNTGNVTWHYDPIIGGSADLVWRIYMHATIADPYITAGNGARPLLLESTMISSQVTNVTFFPPSPQPYPVVIFGSGGTYTTFYVNAVPYEGTFSLSTPSDYFHGNGGTVNLVGNTNNQFALSPIQWSNEIDFSAGPVSTGITIGPPPGAEPMWLGPGSDALHFNLQSFLWVNILTGPQGAFWNGGSMHLEQVHISAGDSAGELGTCHISLPLKGAYVYIQSVTNAIAMEIVKTLPTLNLDVQYVRGDHILQPTYQVSSGAYQLNIGDTTTITVTVNNNSQVVPLESGAVSLDIGSLAGKLNVLSVATIDVGNIDVGSSQDFNFLVEAAANGVVTPQANISDLGWGWPVPPDVVINRTVSIDTNLALGNATGIANGEGQSIPTKFALVQNYPNPFNPSTVIRYQLPDRTEVILTIFDISGREVRTLVKETLAAGKHSVTWNGTNNQGNRVSSGIYLYQLKAGNRSESRRMLLLK